MKREREGEFWIADCGLRIEDAMPRIDSCRIPPIRNSKSAIPISLSSIKNPQSKIQNSSRAFTLIEVIASLVLVAVLAAILWPHFGTGLRGTVETNQQLADAYGLRTEMETWVQLSRTTYAGQFDELPALIQAYFVNVPEINVTESSWVTFTPGSGNVLQETVSGPISDCLRITLRHTSGQQLTFIFTRPLA